MGRTAIIFTIALVCGLSAAWPTGDSRIVGGHMTTIEEVPYQLQMEKRTTPTSGWYFTCGAVIIGEDIVVTAAHCVGKAEWRFKSGDKIRGKGELHNVTDYMVHPDFTGGERSYHDIAVFKVTPPFTFDNTTQKIDLVEKQPAAGDIATISGWGSVLESFQRPETTVRKGEIPVMDMDKCKEDLLVTMGPTDSLICAGPLEGGRGACYGDSGGPFVVDGKLAGLVSWSRGCAEPDHPGIFANVFNLLPWIEKTIAGFSKMD